jgi:MerR family transcriptional regulator, heat shock protein HspR
MELDLGAERPVYGISVAAELTGVNAPMLRAYESKGLIQPFRTEGGTRRYSEADLASVNRITTLLAAGLNLAGIQEVLRLEDETRALRAEVHGLKKKLAGKNTGPAP